MNTIQPTYPEKQERHRKPNWLKRRLPSGPEFESVRRLLEKGRLHTVCQEAKCPNIWECFGKHQTATFLIMGSVCTRNCRFCAVAHGQLEPLDTEEPMRVALAAATLKLAYVVITSVTRDDLEDGGSGHFAAVIHAVRKLLPSTKIEVLIPDFQGNASALAVVVAAKPDVLNHNIETVPRLYPTVRPEADYDQSLMLFARASRLHPDLPLKSGLMLGLGETDVEIQKTLQELLNAGCSMLTLGQYLQPSSHHLPVARFVPPEEFAKWKQAAESMGFLQVASGPFVRSSYQARELFEDQ